MANYKKYAENLIGNWEKDIYEPQRKIAQAGYQTNWNALTNSFNDLKDKLARNYELARADYTNNLSTTQDQSFNRMNNASIDLANRGLSASGVGDLITQGDTQIKGEATDKALSDLLTTTSGDLSSLEQGVMKYGEGQTALAEDLAKNLGGITDKDAANNQQYANLLAGIAESAAGRAASRARSGGGTSKKAKKDQKEADELERRMRIADVLNADDISDQQKVNYLTTYLDVPVDKAKASVVAYNNNAKLDAATPEMQELQSNIQKYNNQANTWNSVVNSPIFSSIFPIISGPMSEVFNYPRSKRVNAENRLRDLRNETNGLTYTDLYNLLYK